MKCDAGQFSIAQMLSEAHNTNSGFFLMTLKQFAGQRPLEIVMDCPIRAITQML